MFAVRRDREALRRDALLDEVRATPVGLDRELYEAVGYRLTWMLNSTKTSRPADVVDVRGRSDQDILLLLSLGYTYGVLTRSSESARLPESGEPQATRANGLPGSAAERRSS